ncbi:hypothetical protein Hdeb2414_s0018g00515601 [Helianthus debilis subsp. tardiflorus]
MPPFHSPPASPSPYPTPYPLPPRRRYRIWGRDTITSSFYLNETLTNGTYKLTAIMNPC